MSLKQQINSINNIPPKHVFKDITKFTDYLKHIEAAINDPNDSLYHVGSNLLLKTVIEIIEDSNLTTKP